MVENINPLDIKALQFRDEFIKLCNKYRCNISGSNYDDGTMTLEIYNKENNWTTYYSMKDKYQNYSLYKEDDDYNLNCVMDEFIKKPFDRESGEMAGLNNIKVSCGIITNDPQKAESKLKELYGSFNKEDISYFTLTKDRKEMRLNNGERYLWVKPFDHSRGYRFASIIIDRDITLEQLHEIILPICYACGRNDVEIF